MRELKVKTPTGIKLVRLVTVSIIVVLVLAVGSVAYSAYKEYGAVTSEFSQGKGGVVVESPQGAGAVFTANVTVPNQGLYPLNVTVSCLHSTSGSNVYCETGTVMVQPGQQGVLTVAVHVQDLALYQGSADKSVNGTLDIHMPPFVSLSVSVNLASFIPSGAG